MIFNRPEPTALERRKRNRSNLTWVAILATLGLLYLGVHSSTSLTATLIVSLAYFLPTIVAVYRKVPNQGSVAVINVFLGWTLIGWVVALAMAARSVPRATP